MKIFNKSFGKLSSTLIATLGVLGIFFVIIIVVIFFEAHQYSYSGSVDPHGGWCDYGFNEKTNQCCDEDEYYCEARDYYKSPPLKYFDTFDSSRSSFIEGAWYDKNGENLLLDLNGKNYWYCNLKVDTWNDFRRADSLGTYYNSYIKGGYKCDELTGDE